MHIQRTEIASLPLRDIKRDIKHLAFWELVDAIAACPKCFREGLYKLISA